MKENPEIASPSCEFMKTTHLLRNFAKSVAVTQVMKRTLVVWKTYEKLVVGPGGPYELASGFGAQGVMRHVCVVNIMRKKMPHSYIEQMHIYLLKKMCKYIIIYIYYIYI